MSNTRQIRSRISTAQNISKITKAMEMVAASKMKRAQDQALSARPYSQELYKSLRAVSAMTDPTMHPLLTKHDAGVPVMLVISTDKGLCGGLNGNLMKRLWQWKQAQGAEAQVIAVGRKSVMFSRAFGIPLFAQFTELPELVRTVDVLPIAELLIDRFLNHTFSSVGLMYTDFINTLSQQVKVDQLLPLATTEPQIETPTKSNVDSLHSEYTFEPGAKQILSELLPFFIENTIFHALLEAKASEHSARMVAMKNASENAGDLVGELRLLYNKSRQQSITSELLDITTAQLTLA